MKLTDSHSQQCVAFKVFFLIAFEYHVDAYSLRMQGFHLHEQLGEIAAFPKFRHIDNSHDTTGLPFATPVEQLIVEVGEGVVVQDFGHRIEDLQVEGCQQVDSHNSKCENRHSEVSPELSHAGLIAEVSLQFVAQLLAVLLQLVADSLLGNLQDVSTLGYHADGDFLVLVLQLTTQLEGSLYATQLLREDSLILLPSILSIMPVASEPIFDANSMRASSVAWACAAA